MNAEREEKPPASGAFLLAWGVRAAAGVVMVSAYLLADQAPVEAACAEPPQLRQSSRGAYSYERVPAADSASAIRGTDACQLQALTPVVWR